MESGVWNRRTAIGGIKNVLRALDMMEGEVESQHYQITIKKSKSIRAEKGDFLQFHIKPGDIIEKDQPLATGMTLLGREQNVPYAPFDAAVIGMTTLPATSPGEPICNRGKLLNGTKMSSFRRSRQQEHGLEERVSGELASNVLVVEPSEKTTDG